VHFGFLAGKDLKRKSIVNQQSYANGEHKKAVPAPYNGVSATRTYVVFVIPFGSIGSRRLRVESSNFIALNK